MADPHTSTRALPDREPWAEHMLRQFSDAQTAHWRFRLFGPLTSPAILPVDRPETPSMTNAAAKPTLALRFR